MFDSAQGRAVTDRQKKQLARIGCVSIFGNSASFVSARQFSLCLLLSLSLLMTGCRFPFRGKSSVESADAQYYQAASRQIEYPDLEQPISSAALMNAEPISLRTNLSAMDYWNLSLQQVVQLGLENSKVMRNLGTTILRSPSAATTAFDPAIRETDPRFGMQAALSAFDTNFAASVLHQNNDRALNNQFFGGGTRILQQEATVLQGQFSKQSASGTEYILRNITDYDKNNAPGNAFPGAWTSVLEAEARQPLLRGYGVEYWQTVGSSETPGVYNGVLIARTHSDISQADFEIAVRDFIAEIENSYWDLYFAYQNLETKIAARDSSLELWRRLNALNQLGRAGGEADKEAQAREQYFRFEEEVQNALNGKPIEGSKTYNGASAGTFKGTLGVFTAERRLRYLVGMPINEDKLIRPHDVPLGAPVVFDWQSALEDSLQLRPELRKQQWTVKQKELELIAAQKLLLPELDVVGLYRWRGFGQTLTNPSASGAPRFDSAWGDLASGNFQEWQLGVELDVPLGNRRANAGVSNAEFQLARARQILKEQERVIVHDLSNAMTEVDRSWAVLETVKHRLHAAEDQVNAMIASFEADQAPVNLVLEAQRRYAAARAAYYAAVLEYNFAIRNLHFEKGSYLEYCGVHVSEGGWAEQAYQQAGNKRRLERTRQNLPPLTGPQTVISSGTNPANDDRVIESNHPLNGQPLEMPIETMPSPLTEPVKSDIDLPLPGQQNQRDQVEPNFIPSAPATNPAAATLLLPDLLPLQ